MEFFLNSSEIDFMILLYLQECGFNHSSYVFCREANIETCFSNEKIIPPGSLISLIQRGFVYSHLENDWFLNIQKNKINSIQNLTQRKKKIYKTVKSKILKAYKKYHISTQISQKKSILFCSWHPRRFQGYFSTRQSANYLFEKKGRIESSTIFDQNLIIKNSKLIPTSYEITSIDFNLIGTLISTTYYNGLFVVWTETGIPLFQNSFLNRPLVESKWNENSRNIILGYLTGEIEIWSSWYSQLLLVFLPNRTFLTSLEWKDNLELISLSKDKIFSNLNFPNKKLDNIRAHNLQINDIVYSCEKRIISSCSDDLTIKLWKYSEKFEFIATFRGHEKEVLVIQYNSPNYSKKKSINQLILLSGSLDFSLRIWDINSKNCLRFFKLDGPVFSATLNLNSRRILAGTCGKLVEINLSEIKNEFKLMNGDYAIFAVIPHPMVEKYIGFSGKDIFFL